MKYFIEARISNILSGEFLEGFQRNLISQMQIGVECGYDEGLKKIKKGLTIAQLYKGLRIIEEKGLSSVANLSFIIGFPWEDFGTIEKTLDTVEYIVRLNLLTLILRHPLLFCFEKHFRIYMKLDDTMLKEVIF